MAPCTIKVWVEYTSNKELHINSLKVGGADSAKSYPLTFRIATMETIPLEKHWYMVCLWFG